MHNLITKEVKDTTSKVIVNFREFYKDKENRHYLNFEDFIVYAMLRGKDMDITIRDKHYIEGKCPMEYHKKFNASVHNLRSISAELTEYFGLSKPYYTCYSFERIKYVFGIDEEEARLLISTYFKIKNEQKENKKAA